MNEVNPYSEQVKIVQRAISLLRAEPDKSLFVELEEEQRGAGTSLEWYGITKVTFERFIASRSLSENTRMALKAGVHAVRVIFGAAKP